MGKIERKAKKILEDENSSSSTSLPLSSLPLSSSSSYKMNNRTYLQIPIILIIIIILLNSYLQLIAATNTSFKSNLGLIKPKIIQPLSDPKESDEDLLYNNRIDYTNHSIIKISNRDLNLIFNKDDNFTINNLHHRNDDNQQDHLVNDNHEILWFDDSNPNKTYAFVRVGPKSSKRFKRDLHYFSEPPLFVTSNLQSWLDAEHHPHPHPRPHLGHGTLSSTSISSAPRSPLPVSFHQKNNFLNPFAMASESNDLTSTTLLDDEDDEPIYTRDSALLSPGQHHLSGYPMHFSKIVPTFVLNRYHPLAQVNRFMKEVAMNTPGVTVFTIGHTHENRPIQAIEILNNENDPNFMWIDGCTHAREWITVTTALYAIEQAILSKIPINFIIVPILNVDGYVFTWTKDRMWRKNRRPFIQSRFSQRHSMPERCTGVDLNRNYDINFGGTGSSKNPCSFLYQGPFPFSEPEVRAASDLIANNRHRIKMTLSLHSFNQLWACPNAFTNERTKDHNHHMRILKAIQQAVHSVNGVLYDIGPLGSRLYLGSGFMMDWIYHKLGIRDAYLVELRDRGYYGFILPADQILPTAMETWQGIRVAIQNIFLS